MPSMSFVFRWLLKLKIPTAGGVGPYLFQIPFMEPKKKKEKRQASNNSLENLLPLGVSEVHEANQAVKITLL